MSRMNTQLRVRSWPDGLPTSENFELVETPMPQASGGQLLCRNLWLSIDPYYRHALGPRFVGTAFCHPGDVMMGVTVARVIESHDPEIRPGALIRTLKGGMQTHVVVNAREVQVLPDDVFGDTAGSARLPLSTAMGVAGIPGLTAFIAVTEIGQVRVGETFLVSSASGCVGATAGQLAITRGAQAIGIAGAAEKCTYTVEELGFAACPSYKSASFADDLKAAVPDGIDVNMEHIGGDVLAAILPLMTYGGRVVLSGLIDQYNKDVPPPSPNWGVLVARSISVLPIRVFDWFARMNAWERTAQRLILDGRLRYREDIAEGLETSGDRLHAVLTGGNFGKTLVRIAEDG